MPPKKPSQKSQKSQKHDKAKHSGKLHVQAHKGGGGGKGTWGTAQDDIKYANEDPNVDETDPNYDPVDGAYEEPPKGTQTPQAPSVVVESEAPKAPHKAQVAQAAASTQVPQEEPEIVQEESSEPAKSEARPVAKTRAPAPKPKRKWIKKVTPAASEKAAPAPIKEKKQTNPRRRGDRKGHHGHHGKWIPTEEKKKKFATSLADFANFKKQIKLSTEEYLVSFNAKDVKRTLQEIDQSIFHQDLPAIIIKVGLDKNPEERAKLASLLHELYKHKYITHNQMAQGFRKIFNNLNDLVLDIPNAKALVSEFIKHAVTSGYLDAKDAEAMQLEAEQLADSEALLKSKKHVDSLLEEYFSSRELGEAVRQAAEVSGPYQFELVKRAISKALDRTDVERELTSKLLSAVARVVVKEDQIVKGFTVLLDRVEDLHKDVPEVLRLLSCFIARAKVDEVLPPAFLVRVDLAGGDMGCQVVEQARVLLERPAASEALAKVWLGDPVPEVMAMIVPLSMEDKLEVLRQLKQLVS